MSHLFPTPNAALEFWASIQFYKYELSDAQLDEVINALKKLCAQSISNYQESKRK